MTACSSLPAEYTLFEDHSSKFTTEVNESGGAASWSRLPRAPWGFTEIRSGAGQRRRFSLAHLLLAISVYHGPRDHGFDCDPRVGSNYGTAARDGELQQADPTSTDASLSSRLVQGQRNWRHVQCFTGGCRLLKKAPDVCVIGWPCPWGLAKAIVPGRMCGNHGGAT